MSMWTLMHVNGCGGPCFKRTSRPLVSDLISPELCRHLDGSPALAEEPVVCETCGDPLPLLNGDLHPDNWVEDVPDK